MRRLWRDRRFWFIAIQAVAVVLIVILGVTLWQNLQRNLQQQGMTLGFDFLDSQAAFDIGETLISYDRSSTYARALLVGLLNSLRVMAVGIILATVVGITVGVGRLWDNWLLRKLSLLYVEIIRNTPLLLQLFFWYSAVFLSLPGIQDVIELPLRIYLSQQVVAFPLPWTIPEVLENGQIVGGLQLSPELSALVLGLSLYTAAFIAEIVRAGIESVPKGQWEAAKSLGLNPSLMLRLVIFPQALRTMIPSLTSQYLNLAKNTSLAIAIGYPDIYFVASTTFNQTGRAVEVMILLMATYLTISLLISLFLNFYNKKVQLKER
ncbi:amino acid ABC transporter permease [Oscillatoria acuminata]|uniref:Neutral amino acid ABC transporter membrane protein n=1 Tax=Oscillatoria acuminata PCC 6304 TaxID=56110 RepID=K9TJK3_9CYAN|nr:ABC transporter permease subunit [Oscillatoria acuminata]AFY82311.1 neutral amino acid ABC transporter membrane protein [Oscillatoria acuminata PCC 6304]